MEIAVPGSCTNATLKPRGPPGSQPASSPTLSLTLIPHFLCILPSPPPHSPPRLAGPKPPLTRILPRQPSKLNEAKSSPAPPRWLSMAEGYNHDLSFPLPHGSPDRQCRYAHAPSPTQVFRRPTSPAVTLCWPPYPPSLTLVDS